MAASQKRINTSKLIAIHFSAFTLCHDNDLPQLINLSLAQLIKR